MGSQVLMVCAANVCRSPVMALSFASMTYSLTGRAAGAVSAGRSVSESAEMCAVGYEVVADLAGADEMRDTHRSAGLTASAISESALIIATTLQERAAVAALDPSARSRTFTLKEAVRLAETRSSATSFVHDRSSGAIDLDRFSRDLNGLRGTPIPAPGRRRWPWQAPSHSPLDLPDAHGSRRVHHLARLQEARALSEQLARAMVDPRARVSP